ncbi:MAG: hypothetical protein WKF36_03955 [Candidatus Nitrosocosmicus sp.]
MYSPIAAIIFLATGAGAIFQVVFPIASMMVNNNRNSDGISTENKKKPSLLSTSVVAGFVIGMAIMYITSLLIPS